MFNIRDKYLEIDYSCASGSFDRAFILLGFAKLESVRRTDSKAKSGIARFPRSDVKL